MTREFWRVVTDIDQMRRFVEDCARSCPWNGAPLRRATAYFVHRSGDRTYVRLVIEER